MKKADLQVHKKRLEELKTRLQGDVDQLSDEALRRNRQDSSGNLSNMPNHMADIGSDAFEQDFTLSLIESEEDTLQKIEDALGRIQDGSFGLCSSCGKPIPKTRLQALPFAENCVSCARKQESEGGW